VFFLEDYPLILASQASCSFFFFFERERAVLIFGEDCRFILACHARCFNLGLRCVGNCAKANPSAKFQYTITKSDISSKDF